MLPSLPCCSAPVRADRPATAPQSVSTTTRPVCWWGISTGALGCPSAAVGPLSVSWAGRHIASGAGFVAGVSGLRGLSTWEEGAFLDGAPGACAAVWGQELGPPGGLGLRPLVNVPPNNTCLEPLVPPTGPRPRLLGAVLPE